MAKKIAPLLPIPVCPQGPPPGSREEEASPVDGQHPPARPILQGHIQVGPSSFPCCPLPLRDFTLVPKQSIATCLPGLAIGWLGAGGQREVGKRVGFWEEQAEGVVAVKQPQPPKISFPWNPWVPAFCKLLHLSYFGSIIVVIHLPILPN